MKCLDVHFREKLFYQFWGLIDTLIKEDQQIDQTKLECQRKDIEKIRKRIAKEQEKT